MKTARKCVGVISDTHGLIRPAAIDQLRGCELLIHCGDVGGPGILDVLKGLAPVRAIRGNVDTGAWASALPASAVIEVGAYRLYVLHDVAGLDLDPAAAGFAVVLSGHSHKPLVEKRGGVLFLNPGSAGPRRFNLPVTVARLVLDAGVCEAHIIELA